MGGAGLKALGTHTPPDLGVIEVPIGTLAGEQIFEAECVGGKEFYMLAAISSVAVVGWLPNCNVVSA
jgi:hypothetical protein